MMEIVWRRQAERDLEHLFDFVLDRNPGAAHRLCERIEREAERLDAASLVIEAVVVDGRPAGGGR